MTRSSGSPVRAARAGRPGQLDPVPRVRRLGLGGQCRSAIPSAVDVPGVPGSLDERACRPRATGDVPAPGRVGDDQGVPDDIVDRGVPCRRSSPRPAAGPGGAPRRSAQASSTPVSTSRTTGTLTGAILTGDASPAHSIPIERTATMTRDTYRRHAVEQRTEPEWTRARRSSSASRRRRSSRVGHRWGRGRGVDRRRPRRPLWRPRSRPSHAANSGGPRRPRRRAAMTGTDPGQGSGRRAGQGPRRERPPGRKQWGTGRVSTCWSSSPTGRSSWSQLDASFTVVEVAQGPLVGGAVQDWTRTDPCRPRPERHATEPGPQQRDADHTATGGTDVIS